MLMLMLWDANVCLTPRGVTPDITENKVTPRIIKGFIVGFADSFAKRHF
jgi:hypothetical protein